MEVLIGIDTDVSDYTPGDGFNKFPCLKCQKEIWIGPNQQEKMASGAKQYCFTCAKEIYKANFKLASLVKDSGSKFKGKNV